MVPVVIGVVWCCHHECLPAVPAQWLASTRGEELGDFCTAHLGDALDDFDGHVDLDRIEED